MSAAAMREVDLIGVFRYANTYADGIKLISQLKEGMPDLTKLVKHEFFGFEEVDKAFQTAAKTVDDEGKLVMKCMVYLNGGR